jgi:hypothetical protein
MKRSFLTAILLFVTADMLSADPISVVVSNSYTKAGGLRTIEINGSTVKYSAAYEKLSALLEAASAKQDTPVVVLMNESCRFNDWYSVRGLMDKIGFMHVRYFVFSKATNYMSEIEPRPAMPVSSNPPKSESR